MSDDLNELESLLFDWESGALDEHQTHRLRAILRQDPAARSHFVQMQMMSAALHLEADAGLGLPLADPAHATLSAASRREARPAGRSSRVVGTSFWVAIVASLLVIVQGSWLVYWYFSAGSGPSPMAGGDATNLRRTSKEATAQGIALVTRLVDVTWDVDQPQVEVGEALPAGRFAIKSGHAQVEFFCGATVVVEGPAELELESVTRARVRSGRLRAHVPPAARGFVLDVDDLQVVDLGTEFGLSVSASGANVQVFDGEVELQRGPNERRRLTSGQAILRTAVGDYQQTQVAPENFVDIADLESRAQIQRSARYERWKEWSTGVRRDPRLLAYYAFDQEGDWERRLVCGNVPVNDELDGAIVGAREVVGRWAAKSALEFKQPADRVRVQIPGEYGSLTLACWVKIDSLDRWFNSLFLTDGYNKGEPHWQILDSGRIYFSVRPAEQDEPGPVDFKALSPPFWQPSMHGKWIHLAVTCDVDAKSIIHYLNGKMLSHHLVPPTQMPSTTRIGAASLGNWALPTMPDARFAICNLNGSIDEFAIFAAALTAEEIEEMYEYGRP